MPREVTENGRIQLRLKPAEKALIARAAALRHQDLTAFIRSTALPEARAVLRQAEEVPLSARDSLRVMELLEHPPVPTDRLRRAARAGRRLA